MVLDSSAVVAVMLKEPGAADLLEKISKAATVSIGAPTLVETLMVLADRLHGDPAALFPRVLGELRAEIIPFDQEHASIAFSAFLRYGKGRHPAALNFGDCLAYAVAAKAGEPLLFKGGDFPKTDITPA